MGKRFFLPGFLTAALAAGASAEPAPESGGRNPYRSGLAVGYLLPVDGSYGYQECTDPLLGPRTCDTTPIRQIIRLASLNSWEINRYILVNADLSWGIPHVLGGDLNLVVPVLGGDITPFLGGGVGLHWVLAPAGAQGRERPHGPALNGQAGLLLFRSHDIHVLIRGQYHVIFNTAVDHGFSFDAGVAFRKFFGVGRN